MNQDVKEEPTVDAKPKRRTDEIIAPKKAGRKSNHTKGTKKELEVIRCKDSRDWKVRYKDGGVLPAALQGIFTSHIFAEQQIRLYKSQVS
jgi:hypothetical protein